MSSKTSLLPNPASNPLHHAWVSANAGAGKTTLLVERVLRLLLAGARPSGIMCLTYTKAAAAEMAERIYKKLGEWAVASEAELVSSLTQTHGEAPDALILNRARILLAKVLDEPDGLRIQTIHSFCQSILQRFPLEAGMPPHFTVMDERTTEELMREAGLRLLNTETHERMEQVRSAVEFLASRYSDYGFKSVLKLISSNNRKLRELLVYRLDDQTGQPLLARNLDDIKCRIATALGMNPDGDEASLLTRHFSYDAQMVSGLRQAAGILRNSESDKAHKLADALLHWQNVPDLRVQQWPDYMSYFLTLKFTPIKNIIGKEHLPDPHLRELLQEEQHRVVECHEAMQTFATYKSSAHLIELAAQLLALYEELKTQHAVLDYDDLIIHARKLLLAEGNAQWVLYKLDGGIDHLLVDEAQDISREQWEIVRALTDEFFSGEGSNPNTRTLFVVGDEKQSIFSFQGAQPKEFLDMREHFAKRAQDAALPWVSQSLQHSYRSTDPILQAVDAIFAETAMRESVLAVRENIQHLPNRSEHAGRVEIWPLQPHPDKVEPTAWELPLVPRYRTHAPQQLADAIAHSIHQWLSQGEILESTGKPIQPDNILILLQRRDIMAASVMRALKRLHIPVMGSSNTPLSENLAVMDLLALAQFLLLPEDDLNLAALLKSPLLEFSEEDLFTLAQRDKNQTLWTRLQAIQTHSPRFEAAHAMLSTLLNQADFVPPFELFSRVLDVMGGRARMISRMGTEYHEPLREFLDEALAYEKTHTPSLQGFVQWLLRSQSQKRSSVEAAGGCVRLMTTHGAKGLEAPIVFLADSHRVKSKSSSVSDLLWYQTPQDGLIPLWPRSPVKADAISRALHQVKQGEEYAEYIRLYYVALTRARDRLYICGWEQSKNVSGRSWYDIASSSLKSLMQPCDTPLGAGYRLESAQRVAVASHATADKQAEVPVTPEWLSRPVPAEPNPTRPLTPSRLAVPDPAVRSPVQQKILYRRGTLIHRLLQYLPDMPPAQREQAAARFLAHHAPMLDENERVLMLHETLSIVNSLDYAAFFALDSLAEVPLSGVITLSGKPYTVSGQVDRLCVGKNEVWVIDYKTGRLSPEKVEHTPLAYLKQMAAYRTVLQAIYPTYRIHCALLWTAEPRLVTLPDHLLATSAQNLDAA